MRAPPQRRTVPRGVVSVVFVRSFVVSRRTELTVGTFLA